MKLKRVFILQAVLLCAFFSSYSSGDQFPFPEIEVPASELRSDFLRPGSLTRLGNILKVCQGLSSEEVKTMLGSPVSMVKNGGESAFFYDFIVPLNNTGSNLVCQYKVVFKEGLATSEYGWRRDVCRDQYKLIYPFSNHDKEGKLILDSSLLFDFNSFSISDSGLDELGRIYNCLSMGFENPLIHIIGHADCLGNDDYNQQLSQKRALVVRQAFVDNGFDSENILVEGRGDSEPLVKCEDNYPFDLLKGCLAPNRRVQIRLMQGAR